MNPKNQYFMPFFNVWGEVKQIAKKYPLYTGLACGAVLLLIMTILSGSSQPKGPIIQALDLPLNASSQSIDSPLPIKEEGAPVVTSTLAMPAAAVSNAVPSPAPALVVPKAAPNIINNTPVSVAQPSSPSVVMHNLQWKSITLRPRDNSTRLFNRLGLNTKQTKILLAFAKKNHILGQLKAGQTLRALIDLPQRELQQLDYPLNTLDVLTIKQRPGGGFASSVIHRKPVITLKYATNTVHGSLRSAVIKAGLPSNLANELGNIFASDTGLVNNMRAGDKFAVLYEVFYLDGKKIGTGNILEAEVTTRGKVYKALRYTNPKGVTNYYTPQGLGLQRAFVRTPVRYSHISSFFSFSRNHPLLHFARPHQGVDFAAPRGTPIKATADGRVAYLGYKGSYGNAIMLNHGGAYRTLYGHMMCFARGLHNGSIVHQNQVIGYVGSTGLASGPHVHYEVLVNGVHRNPLTVPLPTSRPIAASYRAEFLSKARYLMAKLAAYKQQG